MLTSPAGGGETVIPDVTGLDTPQAALAYADADIPVVLFDATLGIGNSKGKQCGNLVGDASNPDDKWYHHVSTDPEVINGWLKRFGRRASGIATSPGAFDTLVIDGDDSEHVPVNWWPHLDTAPFCATRPDENPRRGHYWFALNGQAFGNPAFDWGELRCVGGGLVLPPTPVGNRRWVRIGAVPAVPEEIVTWLREHHTTRAVGGEAASSAEVATFTAEHTAELRPNALGPLVNRVRSANAGTRNLTRDMMRVAAGESRIEFYPWKRARDEFEAAMRESYAARGVPDRFSWREFSRLEANAIACANVKTLEELKAIANRSYGTHHTDEINTAPELDENAFAINGGSAPYADSAERRTSEEQFWENSTSWLRDVRSYARSRWVGPYAVLGAALGKVVSAIPPNVGVSEKRGVIASLNLGVTLVGNPGQGKSIAIAAAEEFVGTDPEVPPVKPGSGEGLANSFAEIVKDQVPNASGKGTHTVYSQKGLHWSVRMRFAEVESLTSLMKRSGSNLMSELRSAWSGEQLGSAYKTPNKITIHDHTYRFTKIMGAQPEALVAIFAQVGLGTPQRDIYLPVHDHGRPERTVEPRCTRIDLPRWSDIAPAGGLAPDPDLALAELLDVPVDPGSMRALGIPRAVGVAIEEQAASSLQRDYRVDPFDAHQLLLRLKVAAALMAADGRHNGITDADWELAGFLMALSRETRIWAQGRIRAKRNEGDIARGRSQGVQTHFAERKSFDLAVSNAAGKVVKYLTAAGGEMTWTELQRKFSSREKRSDDGPSILDTAVEKLVDAGRITDDQTAAVRVLRLVDKETGK